MSDNFLIFIPADPEFVPGFKSRKHALTYLRDHFREADKVQDEVHDKEVFVHCGGNLESVRCPICDRPLDIEWVMGQVEERFSSRPKTRDVEVPCCGAVVDLNNLKFSWPCGFARYEISVLNPNRTEEDHEVKVLEAALGTTLSVIWSRI